MTRHRRDRIAEQATIRAATDRLLAGTPLRSLSGKLTTSELFVETGLCRDVVYEYPDLVEGFKARVKAQRSTPTAFQQLAERNAELAGTRQRLVEEQATASALRKALAELSLELQQAYEEVTDLSGVITLHRPGRDGPR